MQPNEMDLKTWRRYEKVRALYERDPGQSRLRLVLILLYGLTNIFVLFVVLLLLGVFFWLIIMALLDGETLVGVILLVLAVVAGAHVAVGPDDRNYSKDQHNHPDERLPV